MAELVWSPEVEAAAAALFKGDGSGGPNVRRACLAEILGPQLPAEVSSTLAPYLSVLCATASHHHPDVGQYTEELPTIFEECADDAGGADYVDFAVLSAVARDVSKLSASVCNSFAAVKPRVLVQSLMKGHTMLIPYETDSSGSYAPTADGVGQLTCGLLVGAVFNVGEGDGDSSGDEEDPVFGNAAVPRPVGRL